jgi:hypothetical protein
MLYPTKADYVSKVNASVDSLVGQRLITAADGQYIKQEAQFACKLGPANNPFEPSCWTDTAGGVGGSVPATLALTLGPQANFGAFTPGVTKDYTTTTSANVISTAGDATLTVSDPGHLANGAFTLPQPLRVEFSKSTWSAPTSNEPVTITFRQLVNANDALRTGSYTRTLTFTLSTTTP